MGNLLPFLENTNSWNFQIMSNDEESVFLDSFYNLFFLQTSVPL